MPSAQGCTFGRLSFPSTTWLSTSLEPVFGAVDWSDQYQQTRAIFQPTDKDERREQYPKQRWRIRENNRLRGGHTDEAGPEGETDPDAIAAVQTRCTFDYGRPDS